MKKKELNIVATIPSGPSWKWSSFYADNYDVLWDNGEVGIRGYTHEPDDVERLTIIGNIDLAIEKLNNYRKALVDARERLSYK